MRALDRTLGVLLATAMLAATSSVVFSPPAAGSVDDGDASCGCPEVGPYQSPAGVVAPHVEPDGSSAATGARYRVEATGTQPAITLTVRRTSSNAVVMTTVTNLAFWGFSPDQDRFVVTGESNGLHEVHLYNLTGTTPAASEIDIATADDAARLGFSPHGEFFAYTAIADGTANTVNAKVYDARTGAVRHQTTYAFNIGPSNGKPFGEAGYGFSPDDDEFFYAFVSGQQSVDVNLVDLDAGQSRKSFTITGTGFWKFSPCGSVLALVTQNNQVSMEVQLISSDDGDIKASTSYPIGSIDFSTTATHHRATVDGVDHDLAPVFAPVPDVCPPTWPDDAALTPTGITSTGVHLEWSAAADDTAVTAYRVFRGTTQLAEVPASQREYDATGLSPDTSYTFRVQAADAAGYWSTDGPSAPVTTAGSGPTWPEPKTLTTSGITNTGVHLAWSAAQDNVAVTAYRIFRDGVQIAEVPPSPRSYDAGGLSGGTHYVFAVQAVDGDGLVSNDGPTAGVTTATLTPVGDNVLSGKIFYDSNGDGVQNGIDSGLQTNNNDIILVLRRIDTDGNVVGSAPAQSNGDGTWSAVGLAPGRWVVTVMAYNVFWGGRLQSRPGDLQPYVLDIGEASGWAGVEFGLLWYGAPYPDHPTASSTIAGTVFNDLDQDGVRDAGEPGVPDYPVSCYRVTTFGGPGCSTTTGPDGAFAFTQMGAGTYELWRPNNQGNWYATTQQNKLTWVGTGATSGGFEFGVFEGLSSLGGIVFFDRDGDGVKDAGEGPIPGEPLNVCAYGDLTSNCARPVAGTWQITGLPPGEYEVRLGTSSWNPWKQTLPLAGASRHITIATNGAHVTVGDFGADAAVGRVQGVAWVDQDEDGVKDPGETTLPGVHVCVRVVDQEDGEYCQNTGADGSYSFSAVPIGEIEVHADIPAGRNRTAPEDDPALRTLAEDGVEVVDFGFTGDTPPPAYPGAPKSPSAVAGNASATLTWTAPTPVAGAPVSNYLVQRSSGVNGPWTEVTHPAGTGTRLVVTRLANGVRSYFRVAAVGPHGAGQWSPVTSVVPRGVPGAPRTAAAKAAVRKIVLTWKPPATTGGAPVTDYVVQVRTTRSGRWVVVRDGVGTRLKVSVRAAPGKKLWLRVAAKNVAGQGAWSSTVSAVARR